MFTFRYCLFTPEASRHRACQSCNTTPGLTTRAASVWSLKLCTYVYSSDKRPNRAFAWLPMDEEVDRWSHKPDSEVCPRAKDPRPSDAGLQTQEGLMLQGIAPHPKNTDRHKPNGGEEVLTLTVLVVTVLNAVHFLRKISLPRKMWGFQGKSCPISTVQRSAPPCRHRCAPNGAFSGLSHRCLSLHSSCLKATDRETQPASASSTSSPGITSMTTRYPDTVVGT